MENKVLLRKIAERIKEIRTQKGLSQQEFAAKLDYEKSNMSRLESGKVNARITTLYAVAKVLEITLPELVNVEHPDEQEPEKDDKEPTAKNKVK